MVPRVAVEGTTTDIAAETVDVPIVPLAKELLRKAIAQGFSVIVSALDAADAVIGYMGENVADGNVLESLKVIPDVPFIVIAMIYSTKMLTEPASNVAVPATVVILILSKVAANAIPPPPKQTPPAGGIPSECDSIQVFPVKLHRLTFP